MFYHGDADLFKNGSIDKAQTRTCSAGRISRRETVGIKAIRALYMNADSRRCALLALIRSHVRYKIDRL
jgi:hypothetical protein